MPGTGDHAKQRAEDAGNKPATGQQRIEVFISDPVTAARPCEG